MEWPIRSLEFADLGTESWRRIHPSHSVSDDCLRLFFLIHDRQEEPSLNECVSSLFSISLFFSIPVRTVLDGVYWFTAAAVYLWGVPFFISGVYVSYRYGRLTVPTILLLSVAASFGEQLNFATAAYTLSFIIPHAIQNRDKAIRTCGKTAPISFIFVLVVFAPENFARLKASSSSQLYADRNLFEIASSNIETIIDRIFDPTENVFVFFLILSFYIFLRSLHTKCKSTLLSRRFSFWFHLLFNPTTTGRVVLSTQVAAFASLIPLFFAPGISHRSLLPFFLIGFVPTVSAFSSSLKLTRIERYALLFAVCVLMFLSMNNAISIYNGYRTNYEVHRMNDASLQVASFIQRDTTKTYREVRLLRLKNHRFATPMPYECPETEVWMKKYYRLDPDTEFIWE